MVRTAALIAVSALALFGGLSPARAEQDAAPAGVKETPGARMMAPIPDRAPASSGRGIKTRVKGKPLTLPREKPGRLEARPGPELATANAPSPAAKPAPAAAASLTTPSAATPALASRVSPAKQANMKQAFTFASRGDWPRARNFAVLTGDPVFSTLIQWRYLVEAGASAPFEEINSFLTAHPDWPRREAMQAAAERGMPDYLEPRQIIAWYGGRVPATAKGKIRLGEALIASGMAEDGAKLIRRAWVEGNLSQTDESKLLDNHGAILTAADHVARLQVLLDRDDGAGVRRQMLRVDSETQRITNARLRIKASPALVTTVMAAVPESLKSDIGLRFEAARALRRRNLDREAWSLLANTPPPASGPVGVADERWQERHIMARDALKAGEYDISYRLASHHGLEAGANYADAEFLSGWVALRFLHKPDSALTHFQHLAGAVMLPISKARAQYWTGRALEELGQKSEAVLAYRKAAQSRETFYGQLALARVEEAPEISFDDDAEGPSAQERDAFEGDERIIALRFLLALGERDRARLFAIRIANGPASPHHLDLLAQLMAGSSDPAMGVRVAKLASYSGVVLPSRFAPVLSLPKFPGAGLAPDSALVLGLARQESEFDPKVISTAGARGLMQIMPASARKAAAEHKLAYRLGDLVARPQYNMQIGMAILSDYLDQWGGSYILGIASYNAGVGNVRRWVEVNGDPRDPTIDPIDWIERIPFGETRNYVQRVLENVQVYRGRLNGKGRLNILADLYRPRAPQAQVLAYDRPPSPEGVNAPAKGIP